MTIKTLLLKYFCCLAILLFSPLSAKAEITMEECVTKALENYPLIKKYSLLDRFAAIDLSDVNKQWLPRINVYGQLTGQNVVPSYPDALRNVLQQMGQEVKGLSKAQYKVGAEVSQNIWDGGYSSANRRLTSAREDVSRAALDVELYSVRERVENIYFAILLTDRQIEQNEISAGVLEANLAKLRAMLKNGVAMQSDCDLVEAQLLTLRQNIERARVSESGMRRVLELYTGAELGNEKLCLPPYVAESGMEIRRPELTLFEKKKAVNTLSDRLVEASLMPKVGFFAQAYYGYPGMDYFKSMMSRTLTFNILAGVKISWNIDAFYTKKNALNRNLLRNEEIDYDRSVFLFNTGISAEQQRFAVEAIRKCMMEDARIVALRENVRKAAESQLENGVIDVTALITKIADENMARLNSRLHEIQFLHESYKLKHILN